MTFILIKLLAVILCISGSLLLIKSAKIIYVDLDTPLRDKPPNKLITSGPYRVLRNPMALGMCIILFSETMFFDSLMILLWLITFCILSHFLVVRVEEPSLRKKFGNEYEVYLESVSRWCPMLISNKGSNVGG
ncbi:methyltransferase family protein [Lentibacillus songyuanensis]|uniref:methyltransferase family protein n=1 Tax=Lentibacillus songyuanensis TaxID=3136161 RepID=UPI0038621238